MPRDGRRVARGAPEPRPSADIWLDSVSPSTTKPSPEELRQWDLEERGNSGRSFFLTTLALRATSLIAALAVIIVGALAIVSAWHFGNKDLLPTIIASSVTAAWDAAEFGIMYFRGGQGIPRWLHIGVDGAVFIGVAIAAGFSFTNISLFLGLRREYYTYTGSNYHKEIACFALSVLLVLIHICLFSMLLCARGRGRAEKKKKTGPRIMYLPTGNPVVVTLEPPVPPATMAPSPRSGDRIREPFRQGVPPRKPVAGASTGTPYASPWTGPGPDYQPDEAERARAARGELQAQYMMDQTKVLRHERVAMGNATGRRVDQMSSTERART